MKTTIKLIPAACALFTLSSCNETQEKETKAKTTEPTSPNKKKEVPVVEIVPDEKETPTSPEATDNTTSDTKNQAIDMAKQFAAQLLKDKGGDKAEMLGALLENTEGLSEKAKAMGLDLNSLMGQAENLTDEQKEKINAAKTQILEQLSNLSEEDKANMLKQGKDLLQNLLNSSSETPEGETEGE